MGRQRENSSPERRIQFFRHTPIWQIWLNLPHRHTHRQLWVSTIENILEIFGSKC